jgi:hypothetical protein
MILLQYDFEAYGKQFVFCRFRFFNVLILHFEVVIFGYPVQNLVPANFNTEHRRF